MCEYDLVKTQDDNNNLKRTRQERQQQEQEKNHISQDDQEKVISTLRQNERVLTIKLIECEDKLDLKCNTNVTHSKMTLDSDDTYFLYFVLFWIALPLLMLQSCYVIALRVYARTSADRYAVTLTIVARILNLTVEEVKAELEYETKKRINAQRYTFVETLKRYVLCKPALPPVEPKAKIPLGLSHEMRAQFSQTLAYPRIHLGPA